MNALSKAKTIDGTPKRISYSCTMPADSVWDPEALLPNNATIVSIDFAYKSDDMLSLGIDILNVHRLLFNIDRKNSIIRLESSRLGEIAEMHNEGIANRGFVQDMANPVNALRLILELIEEARNDISNSKRHIENGDIHTSNYVRGNVMAKFETSLDVLGRLRELSCMVIRERLQLQLAEVETLIDGCAGKLPGHRTG